MSPDENTGIFNVVIFYDHRASVGPAMMAYSHVTREMESEYKTGLRIWRLDVATSPECAPQANDDIDAAEMVIMSVHESRSCPDAILRWPERADRGDGLPQRALIGRAETADKPALSSGIWNCIRRGIAAQIRLDIFLWAPQGPS